MKDKVLVITNENINIDDGFSCDNLDMKSIPESLSKNFNITLTGRLSKKKKFHFIKIDKVFAFKNIFLYLKFIVQENKKETNLINLIISITPYTFLATLVIFFFKRKPSIYLRSDGFLEYKKILGFFGSFIYGFMFAIVSKFSNLISCREHILKKKPGKIVNPSHLTQIWFNDLKEQSLTAEIKLLYIGRLNIEKGIFNLLKLIDGIKTNIKLNIITSKNKHHLVEKNSKVNLLDNLNNEDLINAYDNCNIFILPSFTEGHPQVLDEALARRRPVIIFEDIAHVNRNRRGIFICKRESRSLTAVIEFIIKNYNLIQKEMKSNLLPTKDDFIKDLSNNLKNL